MPAPTEQSLSLLLDGRLDATQAQALRAQIAADPALAKRFEALKRTRDVLRVSTALKNLPSGFDARLAKRLHHAKLEKRVEARIKQCAVKRASLIGWVAAGVSGLAAGMALAFGLVTLIAPDSDRVSEAPIASEIVSHPTPYSAKGLRSIRTDPAALEMLGFANDLAQDKGVCPDHAMMIFSRFNGRLESLSLPSEERRELVSRLERLMLEARLAEQQGKVLSSEQCKQIILEVLQIAGLQESVNLLMELQRSQSGTLDSFERVRGSSPAYRIALLRSAQASLSDNQPFKATEYLLCALEYPAALDLQVEVFGTALSLLNARGERELAIKLSLVVGQQNPRLLQAMDEAFFKVLRIAQPAPLEVVRASELHAKANVTRKIESALDLSERDVDELLDVVMRLVGEGDANRGSFESER